MIYNLYSLNRNNFILDDGKSHNKRLKMVYFLKNPVYIAADGLGWVLILLLILHLVSLQTAC